MSESLLVFGESAYLLLLARRTLNNRKEASTRGEEYHDLTPFTRLHCGAKARLKFAGDEGKYTPVVELKYKADTLSDEEATQVASAIANAPMILSRYEAPDLRVYTKQVTP